MAPTTAPAPPPPAPAAAPPDVGSRPLRRSVGDRHLGGVAGGLARYVGVDTYVLRAALLVLGIFSLGFVVLAYAAAWVLVPDDLDEEPIAARWYREHGPARERPVASVLLLIAAAVALSGFWAVVGGWDAAGPFPTLLTLTVLVLVLATRQGPPSTTGETPSSPTDPGPGSGTGAGTQDPTVIDPTEPTTAVPADEPTTVAEPVVEGRGSGARAGRPTERRAERRRHRLVRNLALLGALEAGAVTGALWWSEVGSVPGWVVPATMLGVLLAALALTPWWGWSWTVATFATLLLPFVLLATVAGVTLRGGIGHRVERPTAVADLPDRYRLGVGHQELDLTLLDLAPGSRTVVGVETGIGHTEVTVPAEAELVVRTRVGGGEVTVDGDVVVDSDLRSLGAEASSASSTHPPRTRAVGRPGADRPEPPTVVLEVDLGVGALDVIRA